MIQGGAYEKKNNCCSIYRNVNRRIVSCYCPCRNRKSGGLYGIWYANYVIYSDESSERHNVAEYLNQYLEMRLMEDGSAYMEMSYNSEEPDSAEILKVSWKLEGGKMREATSE